MSTKTLVWTGLIIGSTIGGIIPELFGQDMFSVWGIVGNAVGALIGIWIGFKVGNEWL